MNKCLKMFMACGVLFAALPIMAETETVDGITWTYTVSDGKASLGGGSSSNTAVPTSTSGALTIPSMLGGYPVTRIGSFAFSGCSGLMSVTIPDSVTSIGSAAFSVCRRLTSVTIPDSVTNIGDKAFYGCSGLTSVTIGNSVTSIGNHAFFVCRGLTSVTIPDSVTNIGDMAFRGCSGLTSVTIGNGVTNIGILAFDDCSGLASVTIPDSVMSIGDGAFSGCSGLTSVTIPNSVTNIGNFAFSGCSGLISITVDSGNANYTSINGLLLSNDWKTLVHGVNGDVTIPSSVTKIENYAFSGCSGLTSVKIPSSVTSIGNYAFSGCSRLTSVAIPNSVTSIGSYAFYYCSGLTSVTIPDSVASIRNSAFHGCRSLKEIRFDGDAPNVGENAFQEVSPDCHVVVKGNSIGWGVDLPGVWNGLPIDWLRHTVTFDPNEGECETDEVQVKDADKIGALPIAAKDGAAFFGWWTERDGGSRIDGESTVAESNLVLYAHWLYEVAAPAISPANGTMFKTDSCEVSITCETEGAAIYYSDDGSTPKIDDAYLYSGPFSITDTATIKAMAVFGSLRSEYAISSIAKIPLSLPDALDAGDALSFQTDASFPWTAVLDATAKAGDSSARSGAIGHRTSTWLSATVSGAGTLSFWNKVSCEHDEDGVFTWDRLMVYTNDVEIVEWRMDGESDWTQRTLAFDGGDNIVKWVYFKDKSVSAGKDCAWVDGVIWTPCGVGDPIPAVSSDDEVAAALAGTVDANIAANVTNAAQYAAYRDWALSVTNGATTAQTIKESDKAWLSFALGADALIGKEIASNDVRIVAFEATNADSGAMGSSRPTFAFEVAIDGVNIGSGSVAMETLKENLKKVLGIEGSATLAPDAFSSNNIDITFDTPVDGKARFTVAPPADADNSFFMRVKVK